MKKILITLTMVFLFAGCATLKSQSAAHSSLLKVADHSFQNIQLKNKTLKVEVVNTTASTEQGLSARTRIDSDGMLFVFNEVGIQRFWMKQMQFNLDLIWLKDLQVVDISENVPKPLPTQTEQQLPVYMPRAAVNEVLEVPAGTAQTWQLKVGDTFTLR